MKAEEFESTREFKHFKDVMRSVLSVPKERLDELVRKARGDESPPNGVPNAPSKNRSKLRKK